MLGSFYKTKTLLLCLFSISLLLNPLFAFSQINPQINYQGKLTNPSGVAVPDGLYNMNFWLVPTEVGATSTAIWSETRIGGDRVQVTNGLFSVMLGEVSTLTGVDFNQTLYLGVEIGGTGTPTWDGEMSPRKILGAVPAAFEAKNAQTLGGIATSSFLRSDEVDVMSATSSSPILSIIQNGAGKIFSLFSGVTEFFTVLGNGNVGIGTTTPLAKLDVQGIAGADPAFRVSSSTNSTMFTINANGNVGIGTTTPVARIHAQSGTSTQVAIIAQMAAGQTASPFEVRDSSGNTLIGVIPTVNVGVLRVHRPGIPSQYIELQGGGGSFGSLISFEGLSRIQGRSGGMLIGPETSSDYRWHFGDSMLSRQTLTVTSGDPTSNRAVDGHHLIVRGGNANTAMGTDRDGGNLYLRGGLKKGGGTDGFVIFDQGNVGIGTTTPGSLFSVTGTSTLQNILPQGPYTENMSNYSIGASNARWSQMWAETYNVGTSTWSIAATGSDRFAIFSGASKSGTEALSILSSNRYVGIGTSNPGVKLEVVGDIISKGTEWTARSAPTYVMYSVAYGNGLFVAGGASMILTSPDGLNWSTTTVDHSANWFGVAYGNGLFVLVDINNGHVATSPNGADWATSTPVAGKYWFGTAYGQGKFVVVGEDDDLIDNVMTSYDGINWKEDTSANPGTNWNSVTYGNGVFVAVNSGNTMTSLDGTNWISRSGGAGNFVTYGNGLFVSVGSNSIRTSPDGINWTTRTSPANNNWRSVTYGNGLFVAVSNSGTGNRVMTSPDGINWTTRASAEDNSWRGVTYGNGLFVAVASDGTNRVMTSGKTELNVLAHNNIYQGGMSIFGNVGIGLVTPESEFHVEGTIRASNLGGGATTLSTDANGNIIRTPSDANLKIAVVELN
ncbi:MAG TPA: hypothetical protein PKD95_00685, partial [Candidatus Paceibacterota bacterium]|nr:hypothetical protein [Candidatus Paceibacterota bacterium]